jgi:hypothetical protein
MRLLGEVISSPFLTEINWVFLAGIVSSVLGFAQFWASPYAKETVEFDGGGRVGDVSCFVRPL